MWVPNFIIETLVRLFHRLHNINVFRVSRDKTISSLFHGLFNMPLICLAGLTSKTQVFRPDLDRLTCELAEFLCCWDLLCTLISITDCIVTQNSSYNNTDWNNNNDTDDFHQFYLFRFVCESDANGNDLALFLPTVRCPAPELVYNKLAPFKFHFTFC